MKGSKILLFLYTIGVMTLLLYSMHAYYLWIMTENVYLKFFVDLAVAAIGYMYLRSRRLPIRFNGMDVFAFLLIWAVLAWHPIGIPWIVLTCPFTLLTLLLLDKEIWQSLLNVWTTLYAVILVVSLVAWVLAITGALPSRGTVEYGDVNGYIFQDYILCLVNIDIRTSEFLRFNSIFLEPGHVAMIGALTLYANHFDFRKVATWIILIISLITLSLAGWILIAIGYIMIKVQKTSLGRSFKAVIGALLLLVVGYYSAVSYKGGDNLVNTLIVERMEFDDEKGITGNNRTSGRTDDAFDRFINSLDVLTGMSRKDYQYNIESSEIAGAGYKMYLMQKGILGTILVFGAYWLIFLRSCDKRYMLLFFILYIMAFIQRSWPTEYIWLFLFLAGTAQVKDRTSINVRNSTRMPCPKRKNRPVVSIWV